MKAGILRIKDIEGSNLGGGGVRKVGAEEDRLHSNEKNMDIDPERTRLNEQLYRHGETLQQKTKTSIARSMSDMQKGQNAIQWVSRLS